MDSPKSEPYNVTYTSDGNSGLLDDAHIIMNKLKKYLLTLAILLPLTTFASGGDVLEWLWIEFFVLAAFVLTLVLVKLNWTGKGLMIFIFIVTEYLTMALTDNLSYTKNKVMINIISIVAPMLMIIVSYWTLKSKFKQKIN
jgi:hypothetical protein